MPKKSGSHLKRTIGRWISGPSRAASSRTELLLVFVHIPKAAGTSLNDILRSVYGRRFLNVSNHRKEWETRKANPDRIDCLAGHFAYGWHRRFANGLEVGSRKNGIFEGRRLLHVSIVRDPVERTLSYYRYVQKEPKHHHHAATKGMSPREFFRYLDEIGDGEPWSQQRRMMRGMPEDRFFLAAPLPKLEEFAAVLGKALGWPEDIRIPHSNRTDSADRSGFDDELMAMIRERTSEDEALYAEVSRRFDAREFPAFDFDWKEEIG